MVKRNHCQILNSVMKVSIATIELDVDQTIVKNPQALQSQLSWLWNEVLKRLSILKFNHLLFSAPTNGNGNGSIKRLFLSQTGNIPFQCINI